VLALWPNHIQVRISANGITLTHSQGRLFSRKTLAEKSIAYTLVEDHNHNISIISTALKQLLQGLTTNGASLSGGKLEVLLSSPFVRLALLPPMQQALTLDEQQRLAQLQFERIYGNVAKQWACALSTINYQQTTLAAAIDRDLLTALQNIANTQALTLVSITPSLSAIFDHWRKRLTEPNAWLLILQDGYCTALGLDGKQVSFVSQHTIQPAFTADELQTLIQREAMMQGVTLQGKALYLYAPKHLGLTINPTIAKLHYLNFSTATNQLTASPHELNFLQAKTAKNGLSYALFAAGAVALMASYAHYHATSTQIVANEDALAQINAHQKPNKPLPVNTAQSETSKRQLALQKQIQQSLATPWPALLRALETSKPALIMLSEISPDLNTHTMKITGQTAQLADVLAYVAALKNQATFKNVSLLDHQLLKTESNTTVKFEIEALWGQAE